MDVEKILELLRLVLNCTGNNECLTCLSGNINFLPKLQDILEDFKVDLEEFCNVSDFVFRISRGRLRMVADNQCIDLKTIGNMLRSMER